MDYGPYAAVLTMLHNLAAFGAGALSLVSKRQLDRMLTDLDERDLRVTYHPETQSYTVSEMPKG